jgi:hypothetical protein
MTWYRKNIENLVERKWLTKEEVDYLDALNRESGDEVCETEKGVIFCRDGISRRVVSSHPEAEAEYMMKGLDRTKECIIFLTTIGNRLLIERLAKEEKYSVIVYEPNIYLFKYAMEEYDWSFIWESKNVELLCETNEEKWIEARIMSQAYAYAKWSLNLCMIAPPNSWHYKKEYVKRFKEFTTKMRHQILAPGTDLGDKFLGMDNIYQNIDTLMKNNSIDRICDKFTGYPAIIVASGPSLDKNIGILHKAQDKALIITCDASLRACKAVGVKPDAIASIERVEGTYTSFYKGKTFDEDLVLIGPSNLWPDIVTEYPGKMVLCNRLNLQFDRLCGTYIETLKYLDIGASSANVALSYAHHAGCNPIILIGQDLAYTDGKFHSEKSHVKDEEGENDDSTSDGTMVEDIYGNMILSRRSTYIVFKNFIEQFITVSGSHVIDATEGGAKIIGTEVMTLQEAIDAYCTKKLPYHMYDCLPDTIEVPPKTYIKKVGEIVEEIKKQQVRLTTLQEETYDYYKRLKELQAEKLDNMNEEELIKVVEGMGRGNGIIRGIIDDEDLNSYFAQEINQAIMRVKAIENTATAENVLKNIAVQIRLMANICSICILLSDNYQKAVDFLEGKIATKKGELEK